MERQLTGNLRILAAVCGALLMTLAAQTGFAEKSGGVLRVHHQDSPASMSILEEATYSTVVPMMGVFNNLVMYDQHVPQNSMQSIVPDLATSWSWNEEGTELSFKLRQDVKWHDGKPFTAADVKCTFDLVLGKAKDKLRINPRKAWYHNVKEVTANGDFEVVFHLERPQPALVTLLASGYSPIYPCHVSPRDMRTHPIGTGPFKFIEFKPNERIEVARNPDYWKRDRPYLDGIEYTIIPNRSTALLAFEAGKFDLTFPDEGRYRSSRRSRVRDPRSLRGETDQCQHEPDHQPRQAALRQCRRPTRIGARPRSQELHRHPGGGAGRH